MVTTTRMNVRGALRTAGHYAGIATGARIRPPKGYISFTKRLSEEAADGSVSYREVVPSCTRTLPEIGGVGSPAPLLPENSALTLDSAFREVPAAYVTRMKGASVVAHGVISPDGRLIGDLSTEAGVRAHNVKNHSILKRTSIAPFTRLPGRSLAVINAYTANYYHWIVEVVPRIELLRRHGGEEALGAERLLVNELERPFQREVIEYLDLKTQVLPIHNASYTADELVVPSEAGIQIFPSLWASQYARDALIGMAAKAPPSTAAKKRIYVARGNVTRRRIINEAEVLSVLDKRGFTAVEPNSLTVAEQVKLFSNAEVVIGAHGAGLVNTVFCAAGTRVIELFCPRFLVPCYWMIAVNNHLNYRMLQGEPIAGDEDLPDAAAAHILVDVAKLESVLDELDI